VNRERFRSTPVSLSAVLSRAMGSTAEFARMRHVTVAPPTPDPHPVVGDEDLLVRALHVLLETAIKFSEDGETVRLTQEVAPDSRKVIIESRGPTIPILAIPKFFDLLAIAGTSTAGGDLGLGPAIAYRILSLFGGSVGVANSHPSGIRLTVSLKEAATN